MAFYKQIILHYWNNKLHVMLCERNTASGKRTDLGSQLDTCTILDCSFTCCIICVIYSLIDYMLKILNYCTLCQLRIHTFISFFFLCDQPWLSHLLHAQENTEGPCGPKQTHIQVWWLLLVVLACLCSLQDFSFQGLHTCVSMNSVESQLRSCFVNLVPQFIASRAWLSPRTWSDMCQLVFIMSHFNFSGAC